MTSKKSSESSFFCVRSNKCPIDRSFSGRTALLNRLRRVERSVARRLVRLVLSSGAEGPRNGESNALHERFQQMGLALLGHHDTYEVFPTREEPTGTTHCAFGKGTPWAARRRTPNRNRGVGPTKFFLTSTNANFGSWPTTTPSATPFAFPVGASTSPISAGQCAIVAMMRIGDTLVTDEKWAI